MTEANWQEQTLQRYLPKGTTKEMAVDFSKEFISWHDAHKKNEELKDILAEVRCLKSGNDKENLIHHILAVCFLAGLGISYGGVG